jgi:hypothetical protein
MSGDLPSATNISPFQLELAQQKRRMRLVDLTVDIPARSRLASQEPERPSRWRTVEFRIYAVFVFLIVLSMAWVPIRLSFRASAVVVCSSPPY